MFAALLVVLVGATGFVAPTAAATPVPKVALIVGPVGGLTARYRALANDAAEVAQAAGAEVVKVYSPNATWPAVKSAVTGASIVVYLGHGNGWPSRYRSSLYPPTQNGFGLNPVAGGDDSTHQYFGEKAVGQLRFASNAVVVLSHLCYASGNTEPGLAEGTADEAVQRVDNFAAGFLRAGARAVVAEAYLGPAYYVKALLRGSSSVEQIWAASPTANGNHRITVASARTPGYAVRLDPERASSGFVRSLVAKGLTAAELRAGAAGRLGGVTLGPTTGPSLTSTGIRFAEPSFAALPIAGTKTRLTLPLAAGKSKRIPAGAQVSVRWDPILLDAPPAPEPSVAPTPSPTPLHARAHAGADHTARAGLARTTDTRGRPQRRRALRAAQRPDDRPGAHAPAVAHAHRGAHAVAVAHAIAGPDADARARGARGGPRHSRAVRLGGGAGAREPRHPRSRDRCRIPRSARPVPAHGHAAHARGCRL